MTDVLDQLVDRARGMRDLVRAEAAESERLRTMSAQWTHLTNSLPLSKGAASGAKAPSFAESYGGAEAPPFRARHL